MYFTMMIVLKGDSTRQKRRALTETHPASLLTKSIARRTWLALGEANTLPQTAADEEMKLWMANEVKESYLRVSLDL